MQDVQPIEKSKQLLVEGNDQLNFFEAFLTHLGIRDTVQVQNFGGVDELQLFVETIAATREFRDMVESLGIVRDAESRPAQSAFQSVQSSLSRAGLPIPERMNQPFGGTPALSVFILPDNRPDGMLETLLCKTFDGTQMGGCIDGFFECVSTSIGESPHRPDKSRAFAYISTMSNPNVSVGVAAKKRYWDLDHVVFDGVRNFLRSL